MATERDLPADAGSDAVTAFVHCVNDYCALIEAAPNFTTREFVREVCLLLARLYIAAFELPPDPWPGEHRTWPVSELSHSERQELQGLIHSVLGEYDRYFEVYDPYAPDSPVLMHVSEDLLDIYCDLRAGLELLGTGGRRGIRRAVHSWRCGFSIHWGDHLVDGLRALHRLLTSVADERGISRA